MTVFDDSNPIALIGRSDAIRHLEQEAVAAASCDAKVLVTGETGVGKEVVARLVHHRSRRARAGLVTLNCGGLPDSLLESELFGHVRGSFTGAYRDKPGLLESVPHGTLFLDEVGEMSPRMQSMLLRFLESGEIQRVGSGASHTRTDVRLIAATNRDLRAQMLSGGFRQDLYFRLNVIHIAVPALRERSEDIPLLVHHFLALSSRAHGIAVPEVSTSAMDALSRYQWPGNVRELRNVVERVVLMAGGRPLLPEQLPIEGQFPWASPGVAMTDRGADTDQDQRIGELVSQMVEQGESFWSAVHPQFMSRDLTRSDLRAVIRLGLGEAGGSYRVLLQRFNMPADDYKRFLRFLRAHDCHLSFREFRGIGFKRSDAAVHPRRALRSA